MGLDMYLFKETYIGAKYIDVEKLEGVVQIIQNGEVLPIKFNRLSNISEEVMYWRKANQIHNWFVKNSTRNKNINNLEDLYLDIEGLFELLKICKKIDEDNTLAKELLPTTNGFFFGSTDYDDHYFNQIRSTIVALEEILAEDNSHSYFRYSASW